MNEALARTNAPAIGLIENLHSAIWETNEPAILDIFLKDGPPFQQPDDEDELVGPPGSDHVSW